MFTCLSNLLHLLPWRSVFPGESVTFAGTCILYAEGDTPRPSAPPRPRLTESLPFCCAFPRWWLLGSSHGSAWLWLPLVSLSVLPSSASVLAFADFLPECALRSVLRVPERLGCYRCEWCLGPIPSSFSFGASRFSRVRVFRQVPPISYALFCIFYPSCPFSIGLLSRSVTCPLLRLLCSQSHPWSSGAGCCTSQP